MDERAAEIAIEEASCGETRAASAAIQSSFANRSLRDPSGPEGLLDSKARPKSNIESSG
jgi:hypothetical protein